MFKNDNTLYFVFELVPGKKRIVCVADTETWNISLKYWNSSKYPYPKWTDAYNLPSMSKCQFNSGKSHLRKLV